MMKCLKKTLYVSLIAAVMTLLMSSFAYAKADTSGSYQIAAQTNTTTKKASSTSTSKSTIPKGDSSAYVKKVNEITGKIKVIAAALIGLASVFIAIMYMMTSINPGAKDMAKKALYALIVGGVMLALNQDIANWIADIRGKNTNDMPTLLRQGEKITNVSGVEVKTKFEDKETKSN